MSPISRGFQGRRPQVDSARVPPGQHVIDDFPVLSVGSTPHTPLDAWTFQISGALDQPVPWDVGGAARAPRRDIEDRPGFWEAAGYPQHGDPAGASAMRATQPPSSRPRAKETP